jgi:hypothetical protein
MTEHDAREHFIQALIRHEEFCRDGGHTWGNIHDSRSRVLQAERRYHAISIAAEIERYGPRLAEVVRLSIGINELTQSSGGD